MTGTAERVAALVVAILDAEDELAYCKRKLELWRCRRCFEATYTGVGGWRLCAFHAKWFIGCFTLEARDARRARLFCG